MIRSSSKLVTVGLAAALFIGTAEQSRAQGATTPGKFLLQVPTAQSGAGLADLFRGSPGTGSSSPMAFGAAMGDVFIGSTWQNETRGAKVAPNTFTANGTDNASISIGFGLGDAVNGIGLTTVVTGLSPFRPGAGKTNTVSLQAFRNINETTVIAVGVENAIVGGGSSGSESFYGVVSKVFQSPWEGAPWLKAVTGSVGVGGGRFRQINDANSDKSTANVFSSLAVLVHDQLSLLADYTGQDLNLGFSVVPFRNYGFAITPMIADVTQTATGTARLVVGVGMGIHF
ncbi:MAG: hypothetical protein O2973_08120 [Gemmatimonadetes bacterium]|nr:hypothetical protein [Gemmatimonadota bacterium]